MKLSEVSGERVFDVLAEITDPVFAIATDEAVQATLQGIADKGKKAKGEDLLASVRAIVPVLVKTHREDVVAILAAIEGVTPEEYVKELTMPKLFAAITDVLTDEELLSFLA